MVNNDHCQHDEHGIISCVKKVPVFQTLTEDEVQKVGRFAKTTTFKKSEMIFREGEPLNYLFIVHKGKVKISKVTDSGDEHLIRILSVGDFIGEDTLFDEKYTDVYAEAIEETEVCVLRQADMEELMTASPHIAIKLLKEVSKRLKKTEHLLNILQMQSIEQRIATILLDLLEQNRSKQLSSDEITLDIRKSDLAKHIGITAESLSRKLSLFQDQGMIKLNGQRKIIVQDKSALIEAALN